jgi:thiol-disulfide isomerase/thioredoxin
LIKRQHWIVAGVSLLALGMGIGAALWLKQPTHDPRTKASETLLTSPLTDLHHQTLTLDQYRGKVLVVNFWGTWCPPCRDEIPHFIDIQRELGSKGVQFAGIALDNSADVAVFVQELGVNYPIFVGGVDESEAMRLIGNASRVLPYTLIYDRSGKLRENIIGEVEKTRLERLLEPLI